VALSDMPDRSAVCPIHSLGVGGANGIDHNTN
jgi:hypothetical protein